MERPIVMSNSLGRRSFFQRLGIWLTGLVGLFAGLAFSIPLLAYFLGPTRRRNDTWVNLGAIDQFAKNQTQLVTFDNPLRQPWDGITSHTGVFVRYRGNDLENQPDFLILGMNCAHLGCGVEWFPQSGLFMCPCHGGVYYENGERASGPPPRGLYRADWRVTKGELEVRAPFFPTLQNTLNSGRA